ncbi:MAG: phospholipase D-like domain-containing protein [Lachnospiraceae bacterium]|nr:phospholipase D-like domain-containing protein [Lachnospiraceae bacterium]
MVILLMIAMIAVFLWFLLRGLKWLPAYSVFAIILHAVAVIAMINSDMDSTAKITWFLMIAALPVFGPLFYIYTRIDLGSYFLRRNFKKLEKRNHEMLHYNKEALHDLEEEAPEVAGLCKYVASTGNYPVYNGNRVDFYELGEYKWEALLEDLRKAEKFIFLEYFIIEEGKMWGQILKILAEKAAQGVLVRVIYDGTNEIGTLSGDYRERLKKVGIDSHVFSPLTPFLSTVYNNRDHRKILVIDGKVAYNGGVNLADEYINEVVKFGHWKDTAVRIEGPAVDSFTAMFLEMWILEFEPEKLSQFFVDHRLNAGGESLADRDLNVGSKSDEGADSGAAADKRTDEYPDSLAGYVMPYADNPLDSDKVGETVYIDFLYRAKEYVHIMTPYLILDDVLITALSFAARKGVDVELIVPGIPDKKMVYTLTRSYFERLMKAGVKIYTYTPGFVHAKIFVSDDCKATVSTINLDYRSLYHHFECGTFLYNVPCIADIERDFLDTRKKCHPVTMEEVRAVGWWERFKGSLLRTIAPLL